MHPILFQWGPIVLRSYGVLVAIAFGVAIWLVRREAMRARLSENDILDLALVVLGGSIIGARLLYVVLFVDYFLSHPLEVFQVWKGGLVFFGGLMGGGGAGLWFARQRKMPVRRLADMIARKLIKHRACASTLNMFFDAMHFFNFCNKKEIWLSVETKQLLNFYIKKSMDNRKTNNTQLNALVSRWNQYCSKCDHTEKEAA